MMDSDELCWEAKQDEAVFICIRVEAWVLLRGCILYDAHNKSMPYCSSPRKPCGGSEGKDFITGGAPR